MIKLKDYEIMVWGCHGGPGCEECNRVDDCDLSPTIINKKDLDEWSKLE